MVRDMKDEDVTQSELARRVVTFYEYMASVGAKFVGNIHDETLWEIPAGKEAEVTAYIAANFGWITRK